MGQTEEIRMMSRPNRFTYTPITRGHKPTASQESNTLSTMSEVSCVTTVSMESETERDPEARLQDFREEDERCVYRSGSEETVDTVVAVSSAKKQQHTEAENRLRSRNSDYGSYCGSPGVNNIVEARDATDRANSPGSEPLLPSDSEEEEATFNPSLPGSVKLDMPSPSPREDQEDQQENRSRRIPGEPLKTLLSAVFLGTGFLATTASLAFTHERVPETEPLPDLFLDHVKYQDWGLDVSEMILMSNTFLAVFVIMLHSHRTIILRRIWLILGLLYYYRALTMCVTVLPKADKTYTCMPKTPQNETTAMMYVERVLTIISGGGLSINGKHVFCGDYIFSGHTMTLTLGYLAIKQYSPRRFILLHWASFLAALCGVIFLLLARGHYTIDVLLAYYVSSRLWWVYHTLAHNDSLKKAGPHNLLANLCWWPVFRFFETKTSGPLPNRFSLPLPRRLKRWLKAKICRERERSSRPALSSVSVQDLTK